MVILDVFQQVVATNVVCIAATLRADTWGILCDSLIIFLSNKKFPGKEIPTGQHLPKIRKITPLTGFIMDPALQPFFHPFYFSPPFFTTLFIPKIFAQLTNRKSSL